MHNNNGKEFLWLFQKESPVLIHSTLNMDMYSTFHGYWVIKRRSYTEGNNQNTEQGMGPVRH